MPGNDRTVRLRELTAEDVTAIAAWHYHGRDATYDPGPDGVRPDNGFAAVEDHDGTLVAYVCTGPEALVDGIEGRTGVVDLGYGLHPDLVGGGWGSAIARAALELAGQAAPGAHTARALVLTWNRRSARTLLTAGFEATGEHVTPDGDTFVVFELPLTRSGRSGA